MKKGWKIAIIISLFLIILLLIIKFYSKANYDPIDYGGISSNSLGYWNGNIPNEVLYGEDGTGPFIKTSFLEDFVREPGLDENEKAKMIEIIKNSFPLLFTNDPNNSNFFNKHFIVYSISPWIHSNSIPPNRDKIKRIVLVIEYVFEYDWFKTEGQYNPSLDLDISNLFDLNNEFIIKDTTPDINDYRLLTYYVGNIGYQYEYNAYKKGFPSIISENRAIEILEDRFPGKDIFSQSTRKLVIRNSSLIPVLTFNNHGKDFTEYRNNICGEGCENAETKYYYQSCELNVVTEEITCIDAESFCCMRQ